MNTPNPFKRSEAGDTRLLLIIAGCVVAGAAVLTMLAGYGAREAAGDDEAVSTSRSTPVRATDPVGRVVPAVAVPSSAAGPEIETASRLKVPGSTIGTESALETEEAASFEIDPDADFIAEANAAWQARDFERAAVYFGAEVEARPESSWTQYMLGLSAWKKGDLEVAVGAMERALELNPASVKAAVNLARILNDEGSFDEALIASDAALEIDAESAQAYFLRARSLYNLGRIEESVASLETSLSIDGENGHAHNLLGLIRLQQDDETRALASLERAAELSPQTAYVQNNLGMALERSGRTGEALGAYRAAVEIDPGHERATLNFARVAPLVSEPTAESESDVVLADVGEETEPPAEQPEESPAALEIADGGAID